MTANYETVPSHDSKLAKIIFTRIKSDPRTSNDKNTYRRVFCLRLAIKVIRLASHYDAEDGNNNNVIKKLFAKQPERASKFYRHQHKRGRRLHNT